MKISNVNVGLGSSPGEKEQERDNDIAKISIPLDEETEKREYSYVILLNSTISMPERSKKTEVVEVEAQMAVVAVDCS